MNGCMNERTKSRKKLVFEGELVGCRRVLGSKSSFKSKTATSGPYTIHYPLRMILARQKA
jgi:hypothetical protein